jgi:hypothetical protein
MAIAEIEGVPVWATPVDLERWPTHIVESTELGYRAPLPVRFRQQAERSHTPVDEADVYRGPAPEEWLSIRLMNKADPRHDIGSWVASFMRLTGFPAQAPLPLGSPPPRLVEWHEEGSCKALAARLAVDETRLFQGAAVFAGEPPSLSRIYIVLARRETRAWNVCLAIASACLPGAPEAMIAKNDHRRAGAIFGGLLLSPPA